MSRELRRGRFLGVDYGTKRIGLSISDENHTLAFPKDIIENDKNTFEKLQELLKKENINEIVVGESADLKGNQNKLSSMIEVFISELNEKFHLPIHKQKEFLTTVEARRSPVKSERADASAAALILQRYLDKMNKAK